MIAADLWEFLAILIHFFLYHDDLTSLARTLDLRPNLNMFICRNMFGSTVT